MGKRRVARLGTRQRPPAKSDRKFWAGVGAVALVLVAGIAYYAFWYQQVAPDFTMQTLDGKSVTLSSFRGKPVLLNFWASG